MAKNLNDASITAKASPESDYRFFGFAPGTGKAYYTRWDTLQGLISSTANAGLPAGLISIGGLTTGANKMIYTTALNVYAVTDLTAYGRSIVGAADEAAFKALVNLEPGVDVQAYDAELAAIAGLTSASNKIIRFTGSGTAGLLDFSTDDTFASASNTEIASKLATKTYINAQIAALVASSPSTLDTLDELAAALGDDPNFATTVTTALGNRVRVDTAAQGLNSTEKSNARTNIGVVIGTDVQAYDAELAAIAGLTSAADRLPYFTGSGTAALATFTSFGRNLVDDADASAARTTLGLGTMATQAASAVEITGGTIDGLSSITIKRATGDNIVLQDSGGNTRFSIYSLHGLGYYHALKATNYDLHFETYLGGGSGGKYRFFSDSGSGSTERVQFNEEGEVFIFALAAASSDELVSVDNTGMLKKAGVASISNWNTAYGWGNHASAGYLTSSSVPALTFASGADINFTTGGTVSAIVWDGGTADDEFGMYAQNGVLTLTSKISGSLLTEAAVGNGVVLGAATGGAKGRGTLNATAVYDDNTLLTDYVFEKEFLGKPLEDRWSNYSRKSLQEELAFVKSNLHLSTIIGRKEWEKEGSASLGKLVQQLWETAETQFLYITELQSEITNLKSKIVNQ